MSSQKSPLDRILRSLNHPVRRRIVRSLGDHPGSASSLASEFEMELSAISYHLNRVLAEDCNAVDLIKMIPRRGSVEKLYRLNKKLWSDFSNGQELPSISDFMRRLTPGESLLEAVAALDDGAFARLKGSAWEWFLVDVDEKAWKKIQKAREEFNEQIAAAVEESQKRGRERRGKTHEVIVGSAAFPAAGPS